MKDQKAQLLVSAQPEAPPPNSSVPATEKALTSLHPNRLKLRQSLHKFWVLEASSSILSLFILAAIVGLLRSYDDEVYDAITTTGERVNRPHLYFYLAFLSAAMRATMLLPVATAIGQLKWSWFRSSRRLIDIELFDEAANGMLGSIKLMFILRFRHIAAIGAALTILALPLDALVQSAVVLPTKLDTIDKLNATSQQLIENKSATWLERAVSYTEFSTRATEDDLWPEIPMFNAIQFGQSYSNGPNDMINIYDKVDCATGYCKFTKAQTLAVGHACILRKDLNFEPQTEELAAYQTPPGNPDLKFYREGYKGVALQRAVAKSYREWPNNDMYPNYEKSLFNRTLGKVIVRTVVLFDLGDQADESSNDGTLCAECALYWHVKTAEIDVNQNLGNLINETVDNTISTDFDIDESGSITLIPDQCFVDGKEVPVSDDIYYKENCFYRVGTKAQKGLQELLEGSEFSLAGNLTLSESDADWNITGNTTFFWEIKSLFMTNMENASRNRTTEEAYTYIDNMWSNMAFSATHAVRRASMADRTGEVVKYNRGLVFAPMVYYKIDWIRLTMPAFIVVSCAVFVLYTALLTKDEYAWRRSALPLLFHGHEDYGQSAQGNVRDLNVMQDIAKDVRVQLTEHANADRAGFTIRN